MHELGRIHLTSHISSCSEWNSLLRFHLGHLLFIKFNPISITKYIFYTISIYSHIQKLFHKALPVKVLFLTVFQHTLTIFHAPLTRSRSFYTHTYLTQYSCHQDCFLCPCRVSTRPTEISCKKLGILSLSRIHLFTESWSDWRHCLHHIFQNIINCFWYLWFPPRLFLGRH